ncbi:zinc finger protein 84-like protein [Aphelenchoides avenae]|nr:zinc finger protein 84-like protein [Aphelenchus avenae]
MATIGAEFEYYADLLQVSYDVTADDLKKSYESTMQYLHPDNGGSAVAFQEITDAYMALLEHLGSKEPSAAETAKPVAEINSPIGKKQTPVNCHLQHEVRAFHCQHCEKAFTRKQNLDRHVRCHTSEKPFVCSVCEKAFRDKYSLVAHNRLHTGERPHACLADGCTKTFREKQHLQFHMRTHTGERPYNCSQCNKSFARKQKLGFHETTSHSGELRYKCNDFPATFVQPYERKLH